MWGAVWLKQGRPENKYSPYHRNEEGRQKTWKKTRKALMEGKVSSHCQRLHPTRKGKRVGREWVCARCESLQQDFPLWFFSVRSSNQPGTNWRGVAGTPAAAKEPIDSLGS